MTTIGTQAPMVNLDTTTTTSTMPVATAPTPLMTAPCCQPGSAPAGGGVTMPDWRG